MTNRITRILVPVDFSVPSEAAVDYAAGLARAMNAHLELLHVIEDPLMYGAWGPEVGVPDITELLESLTTRAEARLEELKIAKTGGISTDTIVLRGRPQRTIVEHAETSGADLIVMSTHGHTGLSHVVLGSVAEQVVRHATCPVLTLRAAATVAEQRTSAASAA